MAGSFDPRSDRGECQEGPSFVFILVGDHGKDQVENLHRILCNARVKARPSVLWCYKKELGFSSINEAHEGIEEGGEAWTMIQTETIHSSCSSRPRHKMDVLQGHG